MSAEPEFTCAQHGAGSATYICEHLATDPGQTWHCTFPSAGDPWPDALCQACQDAYEREGGWNENNAAETPIKQVCNVCYEQLQAASLLALERKVEEPWSALVSDCRIELDAAMDQLEARFAFAKHQRWDVDQQTATLTFSDNGAAAVVADVEFIGSFSSATQTWLWAWSNFHMREHTRKRIVKVREFGDANGFPKLFIPKWPASEADGWEVAAVAMRVLGAQGVYRARTKTGFVLMALMNVALVS